MKYTIRLWLALGCLLTSYLAKAGSQDLELPQALFQQGQYQLAALEFERVFFNANTNQLKAEALLGKAYCHKAQYDYQQCYTTLNRINIGALPDSIIFNVYYEKALCSYLSENYTQAESELSQLRYVLRDTSLFQNAVFLDVLILNEQYEWVYAKELFQDYLLQNGFSMDYLRLYDFLDNKKAFKSLKRGRTLSFVFPGLGQMYAGHFWRGLASIGLTGLVVTYTVFSISQGYYLAGVLTGTSLFSAFYLGGARHAEFLVEKKNSDYRAKINEKIKSTVLILEKSRTKNNME